MLISVFYEFHVEFCNEITSESDVTVMLGNGHTVKPKPFENELIIIITSLTFSLVVFVW